MYSEFRDRLDLARPLQDPGCPEVVSGEPRPRTVDYLKQLYLHIGARGKPICKPRVAAVYTCMGDSTRAVSLKDWIRAHGNKFQVAAYLSCNGHENALRRGSV